jgi:hypothetical protein
MADGCIARRKKYGEGDSENYEMKVPLSRYTVFIGSAIFALASRSRLAQYCKLIYFEWHFLGFPFRIFRVVSLRQSRQRLNLRIVCLMSAF